MARCEDFPCCGHESGCCPDYDPVTGEQLNMKCVCGATVPITSRSSLCEYCLYSGDGEYRNHWDDFEGDEGYDDDRDWDDDHGDYWYGNFQSS